MKVGVLTRLISNIVKVNHQQQRFGLIAQRLSKNIGLSARKYIVNASNIELTVVDQINLRVQSMSGSSSSNVHFVGVDVGTGSARAALVTAEGAVKKLAVEEIKTWNPLKHHFEQSSDNIWAAVCKVVKNVTNDVDAESVRGIGFGATCSLVVMGGDDKPLTVSTTGKPAQNIILWMDHRAKAEAATINETKHPLLNSVGGKVSVEMELPKLLWLKHNIPETYENIWRVFDLPDFLTWRATGTDSRSFCSVVCKWNFDAENGNWDREFLRKIQLEDLTLNKFEKIGSVVKGPGSVVEGGLSELAACELGLKAGTVVATSLIDAHAGALCMFGCRPKNVSIDGSCGDQGGVQCKMALIAGTSACHMSITRKPCMAKGVWGPYKDAIIPGYYLNEGGQSAAGVLLDHVLQTHPAYGKLREQLGCDKKIYKHLNEVLCNLAKNHEVDDIGYLTKDLHVWPDFHGNRSPIADPNLRGMISGLGLLRNDEALALLYLAFVQALAFGTRHIMESLLKYERVPYEQLLFCGGLAKNPLYVQCHADICNLPSLIPSEKEMVLVGAAALGAAASGYFKSVEAASQGMGGTGFVRKPNKGMQDYYDRKYKVFLEMLNDQRKYLKLMGDCK